MHTRFCFVEFGQLATYIFEKVTHPTEGGFYADDQGVTRGLSSMPNLPHGGAHRPLFRTGIQVPVYMP